MEAPANSRASGKPGDPLLIQTIQPAGIVPLPLRIRRRKSCFAGFGRRFTEPGLERLSEIKRVAEAPVTGLH